MPQKQNALKTKCLQDKGGDNLYDYLVGFAYMSV